MTTANVNVNFVKENKTKIYWTWHDGYQVDELIKKIKKFDLANVEKALDWGKDSNAKKTNLKKQTSKMAEEIGLGHLQLLMRKQQY